MDAITQWKARACLPHFIYVLKDPRTGDVRYVGCTVDMQKRLSDHVNKPLKCIRQWIWELKSLGLIPKIESVERLERGGCGARWREDEVIAEYVERFGDQILNRHGRVCLEWKREQRYLAREQRRADRRAEWKARRTMRSILAPRIKRDSHPPRIIEHDGLRLNLSQWAKRLGLSRERVRQRINKYPVEVALRPRQTA